MSDPQQGDVFLFQRENGGEIAVAEGIIEMRGSLETAAFLSLFGGNDNDPGDEGHKFNWWGNLNENEPSKQYRSRTQHILQAGPANTARLRRIEEAARLDLQWMLDEGIATLIEVEATIPDLNVVVIDILIEARGQEETIQFIEVWRRDIDASGPVREPETANTFGLIGVVSGGGVFQIQPVITTTF